MENVISFKSYYTTKLILNLKEFAGRLLNFKHSCVGNKEKTASFENGLNALKCLEQSIICYDNNDLDGFNKQRIKASEIINNDQNLRKYSR